MIQGLSLAANVLCYLVAFAITLVSGYYTYRQRLTSYQLIREFLILVYIVILLLMFIDFMRVIRGIPSLLMVYPLFSFGLAFIEAFLLLSAAVGGYLRPSGSSYALLVNDLRSHLGHLCVFLLFIAGIVAAEVYLAIFRPYTIMVAHDFAGGTVEAVTYSLSFSTSIGVLFAFFLSYPVALLVIGALRIQSPPMKRAQFSLATGFAGSSGIYLVSSLSLFNYGLDFTAVAYIILALFFGLAAMTFRRAALLAGFVSESVVIPVSVDPSPGRTLTKEGKPLRLEEGELTLVEVDTSFRYEDAIASLVSDFLTEKRGVFVISAKGNRLHAVLSEVPGVKLYTMSESAKYIAPSTTNANEVNIPLFDPGVLLQVFDKTASFVSEPTAIVFDNISDMMIFWGFQVCYKLLKATGEIISGKKAVALFVLFRGAHDEKDVAAIRSIFPTQLRVGTEGVEVVR